MAEYCKAENFVGAISNIHEQPAVAQDKAEKATQKMKDLAAVDELLKKGGT